MFENIGKMFSETGKAVGDKTKQVAETAKLSYKVNEELRAAEELYAELGKAYYADECNNPEARYAERCAAIRERLEKADSMRAELNALKGIVVCENCGAEVPLENDYCGKCGSRVEKPVPPAAEDTDEDVSDDYDFSEDKAEDGKVESDDAGSEE